MDTQKLKAAQQALSLRDISLVKLVCETNDELGPFSLIVGEEFRFQTRFGTRSHRQIATGNEEISENNESIDGFIEYCVQVEARFSDSSTSDEELEQEDLPESKKVASISAEFSALYKMCSQLDDEACITEFGIHNAPFHVWPYWRELLHSLTGRMHLPSVVLPMHFHNANSGSVK